ncbi:glycosyltransferase family 87 protein [Capnocytophaga catalasegens]|uniref:Membrane protein n=1 Tax=Capnocytophaga catalasegens TaxID=1004260 RepID=A0AAV5AXV8_9FLAO|nr:glycosyltransferase family 87 protein [Capnocytophaga catalasegens]GIZ16434.1 membrane protein [Capnocytophaga catalasegens]GJM50327.1 membrane protein [Capnocytophaga catalasegens]GJM53844.1 membrane protein [Capnocytophaga catalasegens]
MIKLLKDYRFVTILWSTLAFATVIQNVFVREKNNNYLIFKGVFAHTIQKLSLYVPYPAEYFDVNHYGILFSAVIAPFAVLPNWLGCTLWIMANTLFLYWAIRQLPLKQWQIIGIMLIAAHDLYTAAAMQQFNISVIALLVGAFAFIEKGKSHWATLLIVIGTLTKIYGIVGLAFFFFSKDKIRFIWSGILWLGILFCLPMLYSSPEYVLSQYKEWIERLVAKNDSNMNTLQYNLQNLSLLGFLQRTGIFNNNLAVIASGLALFALPYLRFNQYRNKDFRLMFLASVSMFLCLFSTGTENSTYIIAYVGVGIWFVATPNQNKWLKITLLILAILGSLSPTDLFKPLKEGYIIKYSLRAVPVAILWLVMIWEMCVLDYKSKELPEKINE